MRWRNQGGILVRLAAMSRDGVLVDFEEDSEPEVVGPRALDWIAKRMGRALFGSDEVVAASVPQVPFFNVPGIYFLIWHDQVVYVGQGVSIGTRLQNHITERRPFDRMAVIVGLPKWSLTEFEHAYIHAWDPPWNSESTRCGSLHDVPGLVQAAKALDKSAVMPWYTPVVGIPGEPWPTKKWALHVLGYRQHLAKQAKS